MSGIKTYTVSAGISQSASVGTVSTGATFLAGVVGVALGAGLVIALTGKALQVYQERKRREKEAAIEREKAIQRRIAEIKSMSYSTVSQTQVKVKLPKTVTLATQNQRTVTNSEQITSVQKALVEDAQRQINQLKSRLPKIKSEYQILIEEKLLDSVTVQKAIEKTEQALNANHLREAEGYLQALDDARIEVMQKLQEQWQPQIIYLQERLDALKPFLPEAVGQELQNNIEAHHRNWQSLTDEVINNLHQAISGFECQVVEIQQAADNLVNSWHEAGYNAYIRDRDNGDVIIEVETHEGVNTEMRIQFNGQQIDLFGPPEESNSCAARTIEAMRLFQEQGYQLEWTHLDHEPVPEEWRYLYTPNFEENSVSEELDDQESEEDEDDFDHNSQSYNRQRMIQ